MSLKELAEKLNEMYHSRKGYAVVMIHLFGVKYADEIIRNKYSCKEIIKASKIPESFLTELMKGIKLSEFVVPKKN